VSNFNEDSLKQLGYTKQPDGSWAKIGRAAGRSRTAAKLERALGDGALGATQVQAATRQQFLVRVTSIRKRLLDVDNLCEKYHVDCCRYAGLLPTDAPDATQIEVRQRKAGKGEPEETIIEIFAIDSP